jgi:hypothetical protein
MQPGIFLPARLKSFPNFQTIPGLPSKMRRYPADYVIVIQRVNDGVQKLNSPASGLQIKYGKEGK